MPILRRTTIIDSSADLWEFSPEIDIFPGSLATIEQDLKPLRNGRQHRTSARSALWIGFALSLTGVQLVESLVVPTSSPSLTATTDVLPVGRTNQRTLSREISESVVIEDVALTLVRIGENYVEVSLVKTAGGKPVVLTLPRQQYRDICYDVQVAFVATKGTKARLGFEAPPEVAIRRREFWHAL